MQLQRLVIGEYILKKWDKVTIIAKYSTQPLNSRT